MEKPGDSEIRLDFTYLEQASAGDVTTRAMLMEILKDEFPRQVASLSGAFRSGDVATIFQASHKLKSTLNYLGNARLSALNGAIESQARQGLEPGLYQDVWDELNPLLDQAADLLTRSV
jgi:HPt (histidine-containing phosphotransfer) domain-containing protein